MMNPGSRTTMNALTPSDVAFELNSFNEPEKSFFKSAHFGVLIGYWNWRP